MHIDEVHAIRQKRAATNHQTYKTIFQNACERIRRRVAIPNAPKSMEFQVPPFMWGRPPYEHSHAVRYVAEKLQRNGFRVTRDSHRPGVLHIDWATSKATSKAPKTLKAPKAPKTAPRPARPALKPGGGVRSPAAAPTKTVTFNTFKTFNTLDTEPKLSARLAVLRRQLT